MNLAQGLGSFLWRSRKANFYWVSSILKLALSYAAIAK